MSPLVEILVEALTIVGQIIIIFASITIISAGIMGFIGDIRHKHRCAMCKNEAVDRLCDDCKPKLVREAS